jgi:F-type H+-transporting ATPase subunit delta
LRTGLIGAARRYARALLQVAQTRQAEDSVRRDLAETCALLEAHPELRRAMAHPAVPTARKKHVVAALFAGRDEGDVFRRFLELLADRERFELLPEVERAYGGLLNEGRGIVSAEAVTAAPLDPARGEALRQALSRLAGAGVELKTREDPRILGGVLVRLGGLTYDGTVRGRLRALREALAAAPPGP